MRGSRATFKNQYLIPKLMTVMAMSFFYAMLFAVKSCGGIARGLPDYGAGVFGKSSSCLACDEAAIVYRPCDAFNIFGIWELDHFTFCP